MIDIVSSNNKFNIIAATTTRMCKITVKYGSNWLGKKIV